MTLFAECNCNKKGTKTGNVECYSAGKCDCKEGFEDEDHKCMSCKNS